VLRIATYVGLVLRRVWAKKGILVGAFLGSTLVVALLVVVPLYESSVAAVDLLFTVRNAPADDVDLESRITVTDYDAATAQDNREIVAGAADLVAPWYPSVSERLLTREFVFIPTGGFVDWIALGEEWKEEVARLLAQQAETGEEVELPRVPYPTPPQEATRARFFTAPDILDRLDVVSGEFPSAPTDPSAATPPMQVVLGEDVARLSGLGPGDIIIIRPFSAPAEVFEVVEVAAVARPLDPGSAFWGVIDPQRSMFLSAASFDYWTSPLARSPDEDPWARANAGFPGTTVEQRWFLPFDRESLDLTQVQDVRNELTNYAATLGRDAGIASETGMIRLLDAFDVRSVVIGGPILSMLALVVGGALYFLIYTAALTLEREGPEMALLRTRGASSWQTVGIHLGQSAVVAGLSAALAPYVARALVALTGRVPPLSDLTAGEALDVAQTQSLLPYVLAGAAITFLAMGVAILPFTRRSVLELRSLAARPTHRSVWQRYNLDIFAIVIAGIILFQLRARGFINTTGGETTLDPVAVISPTLFLFAGALVLLRILPLLLRFVGWLMTKVRALSGALPGWHLGRNPVPYGRLALLVWLTTGFGAFALTYAQTLEGSFGDRAAFAAGSDVRIVGDAAGYLGAPEGAEAAAAVYRAEGAPRLSSRRAEMLAVRPADFAAVVAWRDDFGEGDPAGVFGALRPNGEAPDTGIALPEDATAIEVSGVVMPDTRAAEVDEGPGATVRLLARVFDATGRPWTLAADTDFTDEAWTIVRLNLAASGAVTDGPEGPLPAPVVLHALWVELTEPDQGALLRQGSVLVDDFVAVSPGATLDITAAVGEFTPGGGMTVRTTSGDLAARAYYDEVLEGEPAPTAADIAASPLTRSGDVFQWGYPTRTRLGGTPHVRRLPGEINVLLDTDAAGIAGLGIGSEAEFGIGAEVIHGTLTGFLGRVPTMDDPTLQGSMVVDLDAINPWLNGLPTWSFGTNPARFDTADEAWIAAADEDAAVRLALAEYGAEPDEVVTVRGITTEFSGRPVQVGLVAILFVGAATSVILALAGVTGYVLIAVARRAREMGVLRALGFGRGGVAATFAVEQVVVLGLGAIIGTAGGIALMHVMIPFLQLGETAEEIIPPVLVRVDAGVLGIYIVSVAALLIVSVVWATRRVSVRRMSEVLREVEH
jgi:hypothetical protein